MCECVHGFVQWTDLPSRVFPSVPRIGSGSAMVPDKDKVVSVKERMKERCESKNHQGFTLVFNDLEELFTT